MRKGFFIALGVAALTFTAANLWLTQGADHNRQGVPEASTSAGEAAIGGDYTLIDQHGKTVHASDFKGQLQLVFFGFTHCPDICPTSMMTVTNALNAVGDKATQVTPVFITVDPERDTPAVMKDYISNFHSSFKGLTGTQEQIKQAIDAYKVYAQKRGTAPEKNHDEHGRHAHHDDHATGSEYAVDHSGFIYLMDREEKYLSHFSYNDPDTKIVDAIRPYLR